MVWVLSWLERSAQCGEWVGPAKRRRATLFDVCVFLWCVGIAIGVGVHRVGIFVLACTILFFERSIYIKLWT